MKKVAICFTAYGKAVIEKLNTASHKRGIDIVKAYVMGDDKTYEGFENVKVSLTDWTRKQFEDNNAIIFVGALGIAVRAIAGFTKDKLADSPVIVIDDEGRFVIPVLSGHVGGADKLAVIISELIDAIPVITTSTDSHSAFSADVFAKENCLRIFNREGIKKVSSKAIEGKTITLSIKDYPPKEPVDIIVADETDREYDLLLKPKRYTIGIGMKKGTDEQAAESYILGILREHDIELDDVYAIGSIDIKEDEPALRHFRDKYHIPLLVFDAEVLKKADGDFDSSEFVEKTVGVDNVCERAAVLAAGNASELVVKKQAANGITVAVAKRELNRK